MGYKSTRLWELLGNVDMKQVPQAHLGTLLISLQSLQSLNIGWNGHTEVLNTFGTECASAIRASLSNTKDNNGFIFLVGDIYSQPATLSPSLVEHALNAAAKRVDLRYVVLIL